MSTYIRRFGQDPAGDAGAAEGKGTSLGEMAHQGPTAWPGFCVRERAYREFMHASGALPTIRRLLVGLRVDDAEDVEVRSEQIRNFIMAQPMPEPIAIQLLESYHRLGAELGWVGGRLPAVSVRACATGAESSPAALEGEQDTCFSAGGDEDLVRHVKACWASPWTARGLAHRVGRGIAHDQVALVVVVQAIVRSELPGSCSPPAP
jgi:pyruvate,water dikinase